jgi:glycolate oxidase
VARGSGTGLSEGALPVKDGVVISLARMNRILEVDLPNVRVVVEPGVINLEVTGRVAPHGFLYAPDPSSQSHLQYWRKRGGKRRRRALSEIGIYHHACVGP